MTQYEFWFMTGRNGFTQLDPLVLNWEESKFRGTEIEFPVVVTWRNMNIIDIFPKISGSAFLLLLLLLLLFVLLLGCGGGSSSSSSSSSCCCDSMAHAAYYYYYYYYYY